MKSITLKSLFLIAAIIGITGMCAAQEDDRIPVSEMVDTKNLIFKAQWVSPSGGRIINMTGNYDLTIRPDSVIAFLPYFGRAYSAPIDPTQGGIKFTSAKFDYKTTKRKKNRWEISIRPRDITDNYQLFLTVYDNGKASLRVSSVNRQPIAFEGYVTEGPELNKKAF